MPKDKSRKNKADPAEEVAQKRTWTEEIEVAGAELVDRIKKLAAEGQVRRVRITEPDGDLVLEIPLTIGAVAGGALVLAAPLLAAIGALAALVTKVRIEVTRDGDTRPVVVSVQRLAHPAPVSDEVPGGEDEIVLADRHPVFVHRSPIVSAGFAGVALAPGACHRVPGAPEPAPGSYRTPRGRR